MLKNYGSYFRELRQEKGFTMAQIAEGVTSESFLSKFERGQSSISIELLLPLLEHINVKFDEFAALAGIPANNYFYTFVDKISELAATLTTLNVSILERISEQELAYWDAGGKLYHQHLAIIAQVALVAKENTNHFPSTLAQSVVDYLFDVQTWNQYELTLFTNTVRVLPEKVQLAFGGEVLAHLASGQRLNEHVKLGIEAMLNIITNQVRAEKYAQARKLLRGLQHIAPEMTWEHNIKTAFLNGIIQMKTSNYTVGFASAEAAVAAIQVAKQTGIASEYARFLEIMKLK
ncbi:Rgg/GadR/MutR family transcriptional regulator [Periweissella cryptocerci]|uniref:Rgg/GadR/MutR family transcriptional regulator n=1 Tax=Periweissella cryptocerci TaxID=2506420 RepID=A0A4P6YTH2_9LACO|nr:Rgg/GadR/MutR family transcriptional regulator [Periweissella cryptocerci]QBO35963.1 Rgg/GadR/MutR family transcriptional regulator [Periweissella cryptocerci]